MDIILHATIPSPLLHAKAETKPAERLSTRLPVHTLALLVLWLVVYGSSLFTPPLLDDADATHAQAAAAMVRTGDWVTLHVDGIRYLEKPPLPYWMVAVDDHLFGFNTFSTHLPLALAVLALALLARSWIRWASRDELAGSLAAAMTLTSVGMFLFTRIFIPDVLLALFLLLGLYATVRAMALDATRRESRGFAALLWVSLACAVLTKGLVAIVFLAFVAGVWLLLTGHWRAWRQLHPFTGVLLFLAIAAPWHILAGIRNRGGENGHGFFWFYFINEHVLRFLGKRLPRDYNKVPWFLYWPMHLLWLFPWAALLPVAWTRRRTFAGEGRTARRTNETVWMLCIFSAFVLIFFSLSTNQEYYTLPVYVPLLMLLALPLADACRSRSGRAFGAGLTVLAGLGLLSAAALVFGLWSARGLPGTADIGPLLAHRGVGDYTLSTSHLFDLTGRSFAALRQPAVLALIAFGVGFPIAWIVGVPGKRRLPALWLTAGATALFLIAAHMALGRFSPLLSSEDFAVEIRSLTADHQIAPDTRVLLYGDQAYGSSIPFYLGRQVTLVDGRSTSMLFGSTFADAPPVFWTPAQLRARWSDSPERLILSIPAEHRDDVDHLLAGMPSHPLRETAGKLLVTNQPLDLPSPRASLELHTAHP